MMRLLPIALFFLASPGCRTKDATTSDKTKTHVAKAHDVNLHDSNGVPSPSALTIAPERGAEMGAEKIAERSAAEDSSIVKAIVDSHGLVGKDELAHPQPEAKWTSERLVVLARGGPRIIDVHVNVAGRDLMTGFTDAAATLSSELGIDWNSPVTWDSILEKPLIQSGWLGNLVPTAEQREQLLGLYDNNGDRLVDSMEFRAFLTRGLSRNRQLRLVHVRATESGLRSASVWGPIDQNEDGELSETELSQIAKSLLQYDFDGDRILTRQEFQSSNESAAEQGNMARPVGMLESTAVHLVDSNKFAPVAQSIFEEYTFTEAIPRDALSNWSDDRFGLLADTITGDVPKRNLSKLASIPPDATFRLSFADPMLADSSEFANVELDPSSNLRWSSAESLVTTGRLSGPGLIATVGTRDDHSADVRRSFIDLLAAAEGNPQIRTQLTSQLELKAGAFDLLDEIEEKASEKAWMWVSSPRDWHFSVQWNVIERAWYEIVDSNADGRISHVEMDGFGALAKSWDRDADGAIQASEMPLAINLLVARLDNRGMIRSAGGSIVQKRGAIAPSAPAWFVGMDYNLDGGITRTEFLGEDLDFERLDKNRDGILDLTEVLAPKKSPPSQ